jgi:selenobiotic family peptide radical SAM maturase
MKAGITKKMEEIYPHCRSCLGAGKWDEMIEAMRGGEEPDGFAVLLSGRISAEGLPPFLSDLARLEGSIHRAKKKECSFAPEDHPTVNPSLELVRLSWKNLLAFMNSGTEPEEGQEFVVAFQHPKEGQLITRIASDDDLLALKLVVDGVSSKEAAKQGKVPVATVDSALDRAFRNGLLIAPLSKIRRDSLAFPLNEDTNEAFISVPVFTLQWHITQACELHCKHCYDRSKRHSLKLTQAMKILEDLYTFCKSRNVRGQVSFSGGNPLLYPRFMELYRAASDLGFALAILGNPAPRTKIERIVAVEPPAFYQVSLEGLQRHNDEMRGPGHYGRVMTFLDALRDLRIYSMVMLTLTKDNIDQVLPLAEKLRNKADLLTFNRLSMVGEGAKLQLPTKERYVTFLEEYVQASKSNPAIALKDNLINIMLQSEGTDLFGGCAGYGCGAAFNFISVLPDGEAHACRKFPSPIGNVLEEGIEGVYDSAAAKRYRSGCAACSRCNLRPVCGGCLAVSHSFGLDVFEERDPFCFMS